MLIMNKPIYIYILLLSRPLHSIKVICTEKLSEKIQNCQKWLFQIFSDIFSQKDWYKFRMAKNGCSKFFLTIFPKKTDINSEWPKMAVPNFFPTIFPEETGINLEWPKMAIPIFFQQFFQKRLV